MSTLSGEQLQHIPWIPICYTVLKKMLLFDALVCMEFNVFFFFFNSEIRGILHGLGEEKPRQDVVREIYSVLLKQMALLIFRTSQAAKNDEKIRFKHVLSVIQHHKATIIRILSYYRKYNEI